MSSWGLGRKGQDQQGQHQPGQHRDKHRQRSSDTLASKSCSACRLRRRRCDKQKPVCSACAQLNIPAHLCVYFGDKVTINNKNSKETLQQLKKQNKQLIMEQLKTRFEYEKKYLAAHPRPDIYTVVCEPVDDDDFGLRDQYKYQLLKGSNGYFGILSWVNLLRSHDLIWDFVKSIIARIYDEQRRAADAARRIQVPPPRDDRKSQFNLMKNNMIEVSLGIKPLKFRYLYSLMKEIVKSLPKYKTITMLLAKFFHLNVSLFYLVGEGGTIRNLNKIFTVDETTNNVKLIENMTDEQIIDAAGVLSVLLVTLAFPIMYLLTEKSCKLPLKEYHFMFYFYEAEVLVSTICSLIPSQDIPLDILITTVLIRRFSIYLPGGEREGHDSSMVRNRIVVLSNLCRIYKLDQDIDEVHKDKSWQFRISLKMVYYQVVIYDMTESLECGLPPSIRLTNLYEYDKDGILDFGTINLMKMLNKIMNKFYDYDSLLNPLEFIAFVENDLIFEIQTVYYLSFDNVDLLMKSWVELDIEECGKRPEVYTLISYRISISLLCFTFLLTLYEVCSKKLKKFKKYISEQQSFININMDIDQLIRKYDLLSIKYAFLLLLMATKTMQGFQRLFNTPNPPHYYSIVLAVYICYNYVVLGMKRAVIVIEGYVVDNLEFDKDVFMSAFKSGIYNLENIHIDETKFNNLIEIIDFFEIKDLQDYKIDREMDKLLRKFESKLLDPKVLAIKCLEVVYQYIAFLKNDRIDMDYFKNNFVFYNVFLVSTNILSLINNNQYSLRDDDNESIYEDYLFQDLILKQPETTIYRQGGFNPESTVNTPVEMKSETASVRMSNMDSYNFDTTRSTSNDADIINSAIPQIIASEEPHERPQHLPQNSQHPQHLFNDLELDYLNPSMNLGNLMQPSFTTFYTDGQYVPSTNGFSEFKFNDPLFTEFLDNSISLQGEFDAENLFQNFGDKPAEQDFFLNFPPTPDARPPQ